MEAATRKRTLVWTLVGAGALLAAALAWGTFAPKPSEVLDEAPPEDALLIATGTFRDGAPGHTVRGTVQLLRSGEGHVLRFVDYEATPGPAVYFYLTRDPAPADEASVEGEGLRIPVEATMRGSFNLELPEGVAPDAYAGLAVWCERFNVLFGSAQLA